MFESSVRKPSGTVIFTSPEGMISEADTVQCVHCGGHFQWVKGSGIKRSYCMACKGMTCGGASCVDHFPFEKKLDLYEKGKIKVI